MGRFVITIDVGNRPDFMITALLRQFQDSISKVPELEGDFFMLFPVRNQPTDIFSLDADPENIKDIKEFEDLLKIVTPVLKATIDGGSGDKKLSVME